MKNLLQLMNSCHLLELSATGLIAIQTKYSIAEHGMTHHDRRK